MVFVFQMDEFNRILSTLFQNPSHSFVAPVERGTTPPGHWCSTRRMSTASESTSTPTTPRPWPPRPSKHHNNEDLCQEQPQIPAQPLHITPLASPV